MKTLLTTISQKLSAAIKAHFDKNPNDVVALSFGALVLAFILLITPHIPQNASSDFAKNPPTVTEVNTQFSGQNVKVDDHSVQKATLK